MTGSSLRLPLYTLTISLVLFACVAWLAISGISQQLDDQLVLAIHTLAQPTLTSFVIFITHLGGEIILTAMALLLLAILLVRKSYSKSLFLIVAVGGSALVNLVFKSIFERARPELWDRAVEVTNYSFPSGHALSTSAFALTVVVLLWHTKWRTAAIIAGAVYVAAVGLTRLYLGVHYPTDVIGGWLLGIAWVATTAIILGIHKAPKAEKAHSL